MSRAHGRLGCVFIVLTVTAAGTRASSFDDDGSPQGAEMVADLAAFVASREARWVWDDTRRWYPQLLAAGVRVERCVDLRLSHAILRNSALTAGSAFARAPRGPWDDMPVELLPPRERGTTLFDFDEEVLEQQPDPVAEWLAQRTAVAASADSGRLNLLLSAESAGALIACEMKFAGLPVDARVHDRLLTELVGPRPSGTERPAKLEGLLAQLRQKLQGEVNPDSPIELLKALGRAGIQATSTRSWELKDIDHPAIRPLLEYKKLSRLLSANGWTWLETWVADGRFRPDYVPGGVVTGRWGATGGGALQLPKQIRGSVVADAGWKLVVADASQLEPRILTAMSADRRMAEAGKGDLYEGIVESGAVKTRAEAKVAMLGAMYGATTGESGRLLPGLAKAFPQALALVEAAARTGERGGIVSTQLGRSSPPPSAEWRALQGDAGTDAATERRARSASRSWGRFTRNFIVQGTAAEWALCWMAGLRGRLWALGEGSFLERPHLVFFLHDEVMVHAPADLADAVVAEIRAAAVDAGRLIFGGMPVQFPVTTVVVDNYAEAK
ncbi:bifunctional 3'-5' exonuclease/DNA polymerase [soil metagenome]